MVASETVRGDCKLPSRFPGDLTWSEEIRLLFPLFLELNPRTFIGTGRNRQIIPYTTLMCASKIDPLLFMSLVLQRVFDRLIPWISDEEQRDPDQWRLCNLVKFPPLKADYPVPQSVLDDLRARLAPHRVQINQMVASEMVDVLPTIFTPEERDHLRTCKSIDDQFEKDKYSFLAHLL